MPFIFAFCLVFTAIMALIPSVDAPNPFNLWDKAQHALAFATLALTGSLAYTKKTNIIYTSLILYGALIEILQATLTTTRVGEMSDLLADGVGVGLGFFIYLITKKIIEWLMTERP